MTKMKNLNNENKTKSVIFCGAFSNLTPCLFLYFSDFQNQIFLNFMTTVNPNIVNETKLHIFSWQMFKSAFSLVTKY